MDPRNGGNVAGDDEASFRSGKRKRQYHRHSAHQIQQLQAFYKDCPSPDESQRVQLSREVGLASRQVKFWFQNKRTQMKTQNERVDNDTLRAANHKLQMENATLSQALRNPCCPNCEGLNMSCEEQARQLFFHTLLHENLRLREEYQRLLNLLAFSRRPPPPGI